MIAYSISMNIALKYASDFLPLDYQIDTEVSLLSTSFGNWVDVIGVTL